MADDQRVDQGGYSRWLQRILLAVTLIGAATGIRNLPIGGDGAEDSMVADWPAYGRDSGGSRFSPLSHLRHDNVRHLEVAWVYRTGDWSDGEGDFNTTSAFEATPILVDGVMYVPTPFNRVIALDPATGTEIWVFDPEIDVTINYGNQLTTRGVAHWRDGDNPSDALANRILLATNDARLIAIDAKTGERCADFGGCRRDRSESGGWRAPLRRRISSDFTTGDRWGLGHCRFGSLGQYAYRRTQRRGPRLRCSFGRIEMELGSRAAQWSGAAI